MDVDLDLSRIEEAARTADRAFRDSPQFVSDQLCAALGRNVLVKIETANPVGSFKGRGASFLVRSLPAGSTVVCASSGNFGVALAYAARTRGMGAHVYLSPSVNPAKLATMQGLRATVTVADGDAAKAARARVASHPGCVLANNHPAVAEGAGTIGRTLAPALRCRAGPVTGMATPIPFWSMSSTRRSTSRNRRSTSVMRSLPVQPWLPVAGKVRQLVVFLESDLALYGHLLSRDEFLC